MLTGGALIGPRVATLLLGFDLPYIDTGIDTPPEAAISVIMLFYVIAAVFNWFIPNTGVDHRMVNRNPLFLIGEFAHCVSLLWRDKLGQVSLATTTLFWGAGATLQFILIDWAAKALGLNLSQASMLQGVVAAGIAAGAVIAARYVSLRGAVKVLPIGITMGFIVISMIFVTQMSAGDGPDGRHRRVRGLLRRADERAAAASRPRADGRRALDRRAEFQREHRHPGDGRPLLADGERGHRRRDRHRAVRPLRLRDDGARDAAPSAQPGARRSAAPHRRATPHAAAHSRAKPGREH